MCEPNDLVDKIVAAVAQVALPPKLLARDWLSAAEVADRIGVSTKTLANWRYLGKGPRFQRLSPRKVVYPVTEVLVWENSRPVVSNTIQAAAMYADLDEEEIEPSPPKGPPKPRQAR